MKTERILDVVVYGEPLPQPRPRTRAFKLGDGKIRVVIYDPPVAKVWKECVRAQVRAAWKGEPIEALRPLVLTVEFYVTRPKSVKRLWVTVKPDTSNLAKAIEDALNGLVYVDDAQIVEIRASKQYATTTPGVRVMIDALSLDLGDET